MGAVPAQVMDIEEWGVQVQQLLERQNISHWELGELLRQGQRVFGLTIPKIVDRFNISRRTVRRYIAIVEAFPPEMRYPDVAWSVYDELLALPKAEWPKWIDLYRKGAVRFTALRHYAREVRLAEREARKKPVSPCRLSVEVPEWLRKSIAINFYRKLLQEFANLDYPAYLRDNVKITVDTFLALRVMELLKQSGYV